MTYDSRLTARKLIVASLCACGGWAFLTVACSITGGGSMFATLASIGFFAAVAYSLVGD